MGSSGEGTEDATESRTVYKSILYDHPDQELAREEKANLPTAQPTTSIPLPPILVAIGNPKAENNQQKDSNPCLERPTMHDPPQDQPSRAT